MSFNTLLNIHQSMSVSTIKSQNRQLIDNSMKQNIEINKIQEKINESNSINTEILKNQLNELKQKEEQKLLKSFAFNNMQKIEKIEKIENNLLKTYILRNYSLKIRTSLENFIDELDELSDKDFCLKSINKLDSLLDSVKNYDDEYLKSELYELEIGIIDYDKLIKSEPKMQSISSPGNLEPMFRKTLKDLLGFFIFIIFSFSGTILFYHEKELFLLLFFSFLSLISLLFLIILPFLLYSEIIWIINYDKYKNKFDIEQANFIEESVKFKNDYIEKQKIYNNLSSKHIVHEKYQIILNKYPDFLLKIESFDKN